MTLATKLSEMEEESRRVHAEKRHLEGSYKLLYNDMAELRQLLQEKDATIERMSRQLQTYEKTVADLMKIVEHTKGQSRNVKDFRQQLAKTEVHVCCIKSACVARADVLGVTYGVLCILTVHLGRTEEGEFNGSKELCSGGLGKIAGMCAF